MEDTSLGGMPGEGLIHEVSGDRTPVENINISSGVNGKETSLMHCNANE